MPSTPSPFKVCRILDPSAYRFGNVRKLWETLRRCSQNLAPVVQKVDNATHRINHYPLDNAIGFSNHMLIRWIVIYPVDSAIQLLNNWGLAIWASQRMLFDPTKTFCLFYIDFIAEELWVEIAPATQANRTPACISRGPGRREMCSRGSRFWLNVELHLHLLNLFLAGISPIF